LKLSEIRDIDRVYVFKAGEFAGTLTRTPDGSVLDYDKQYLEYISGRAISGVALTLPASTVAYSARGDNLHPFFAGLLPEGLRLTALVSALKTSADDMFSILAASGTDCIGDVFVSLEPRPPEEAKSEEGADFASVSFDELFQQSISADDYQSRLRDPSIPGIHPKISAEMISFPVAIKRRTKRYILKLSPEKCPKLVENEHFFMEMARDCGIDAAPTAIVFDRDARPGLLVERFDRVYQKDRRNFAAIHQEDACQFLGRYPADKYRLSLRTIADGLNDHCSSPVIDIARLIELYVFSYVIANGDLHAKNISILCDADSGRIGLSPAYDLLSTLPYGDQQMALQFEGKRDKIRANDFIVFGERFEIRRAVIVSMLNRIAEKTVPWIDRLETIGLEKKKTDFLGRKMRERLEHLRV
jgi:serine/threonine-protein kinase HipA